MKTLRTKFQMYKISNVQDIRIQTKISFELNPLISWPERILYFSDNNTFSRNTLSFLVCSYKSTQVRLELTFILSNILTTCNGNLSINYPHTVANQFKVELLYYFFYWPVCQYWTKGSSDIFPDTDGNPRLSGLFLNLW